MSSSLNLTSAELKALAHIGAIYLDRDRLTEDQSTLVDQTVRIHLKPKRYPQALRDWTKEILHIDKEFLIINKPQGVPSHPTLDNRIENVLHQVSEFLGEKLFPAQRLDVGTSGVCLLSRSAEFQKRFHQLLKSNDTEKIYETLVVAHPTLGYHCHYMEQQKRAPQKIFAQPAEGRKKCELEILSVIEADEGFRVRLKILTGRTHQIRAQLAFLGCPLLGDELYGASNAHDFFLHATDLIFNYRGLSHSFSAPPKW